MPPRECRLLHWVLKVADRTGEVEFLHDVLGMHALRHEEFAEGCKAACNGPYDGRWSKTMLGYGPEDTNFVLELTYNYGVHMYHAGNDLCWIKIKSRPVFETALEKGIGKEVDMRLLEVKSPSGATFRIVDEDPAPDCGPLSSISLHVTDLAKSQEFWCDAVGLLEVDRGDDFIVLSAGAAQATLRLAALPAGQQLSRGSGYGRLALGVLVDDLAPLQGELAQRGHSVLTPLVTLETPGKATVQVVIAADPDGHEVTGGAGGAHGASSRARGPAGRAGRPRGP